MALSETRISFKLLYSRFKQQEGRIIDMLVEIRKDLVLVDKFGNDCLKTEQKLNDLLADARNEKNKVSEEYNELLSRYKKLLDKKNAYKSKLCDIILNQSYNSKSSSQKESFKNLSENSLNEYNPSRVGASLGTTTTSVVLVGEEEDDEYFEISHKRKAPPTKEPSLEVPDTICESANNSQNSSIEDQPNKRRRTSPNSSEVVLKLMQPQEYFFRSECSSNIGHHSNVGKGEFQANDKSPLLVSNSKLKEIASQVDSQPKLDKELNRDKLSQSLKEVKDSRLNKGDNKLKVRDINALLESPSSPLILAKNATQGMAETDKTQCPLFEMGRQQQTEDKDETQIPQGSNSGSETLFVKPDKNKWKLKVTGRFTSSKLKQTQLGFQKDAVKMDISNIPILDEATEPTSSQHKIPQTNKNKGKREPAKLVIEDTQIESEDGLSDQSLDNTELKEKEHTHSKRTSIESLPEDSLFQPQCVSTQLVNEDKGSKDNTPLSRNDQRRIMKNSTDKPSSSIREALFLPVRSEKKEVDFTSQWKCQNCKDYYISSYGIKILKIRPPPKKCGHKHRLPATPPDFWDVMCD